MYQQLTLVGRLGREPEMRTMPDGTAVTNFSLATERKWRSGETGELTSETTWFRVQVTGGQAEACHQYLQRGSKVLVAGRLTPDPASGGPRLYKRSDGTMGANYEVRADQVRFLNDKPQEEEA
ncbi:MAG: single-stranded DNA-binding protein [Chloroflexi bacterium]|nr:single-stranded DNA-binding protein [Chloroflexota bacterium]